MISKDEVVKTVVEARRELGFQIRVKPEIVDAYYDAEKSHILIIVADRPDKSAVIGPGGWVLKLVRDKIGVKSIAVRSVTDLVIKRERIIDAISMAKKLIGECDSEIKRIFCSKIIPMLENELKYPFRRLFKSREEEKHKIVIGLSGGVDSVASLLISKLAGLNPIAVSVDAGGWMLPPETKSKIELVVKKLKIPHEYIYGEKEIFKKILDNAMEGKRHLCKRCHKEIEQLVINYAKKHKIPLVGFGDLLPTGKFSVYKIEGNLIRFNVAAALSLTKTDTILMAKSIGHPGTKFFYGCPLLKIVHKRHESFKYVSASRVLREVRAQILEPAQALKYIKSIFSR